MAEARSAATGAHALFPKSFTTVPLIACMTVSNVAAAASVAPVDMTAMGFAEVDKLFEGDGTCYVLCVTCDVCDVWCVACGV